MRYLIIRRKTKKILLFFLLATVFVSAAPWVYENLFIREEDFSDAWNQRLDYPRMAPGTTEINKDISLDLSFLNNGYVFSKFRIEDLNLKGTTVSADIIVKGQIIKDEEDGSIGFSGKLFSRNITLNSNPFMAVRTSFNITRDELQIKSLRFGRSYELKGRLGLVEPFETELQFEIARASIRDIAIIAKAKNPDVVLGVMSGVFHIKGTLANLFSDGILESKNGKIGPIGYDLATVRFEGFGPIINIVDSSVKQGNGTLTMEGYIDLRSVARGSLFDGLRIKSDMKTIVWDDWDITKKGTDELSMTKDVSDNIRIGFKTMARDPNTTYYDEENPEEMSLEYRIGLQNLRMRLREDEEFFGIEHSIKF